MIERSSMTNNMQDELKYEKIFKGFVFKKYLKPENEERWVKNNLRKVNKIGKMTYHLILVPDYATKIKKDIKTEQDIGKKKDKKDDKSAGLPYGFEIRKYSKEDKKMNKTKRVKSQLLLKKAKKISHPLPITLLPLRLYQNRMRSLYFPQLIGVTKK